MNKNEKANAGNIGSNTDLAHGLTMNNNTPNQNKFQIPNFDESPNTSRRDLLESTKLSRLPQRKPFTLEGITFPKSKIVCVNCKTGLTNETDYLQSIQVCRKCLGVYATVLGAIEAAEERKRRETLERFAAGVNR